MWNKKSQVNIYLFVQKFYNYFGMTISLFITLTTVSCKCTFFQLQWLYKHKCSLYLAQKYRDIWLSTTSVSRYKPKKDCLLSFMYTYKCVFGLNIPDIWLSISVFLSRIFSIITSAKVLLAGMSFDIKASNACSSSSSTSYRKNNKNKNRGRKQMNQSAKTFLNQEKIEEHGLLWSTKR